MNRRLRAGLAARWRRVAATGDAGSSTVEVTLLAPLLVGLLLFIVLCGRLVAVQLDVDAAASGAARTGSIARTESAARIQAEQTARDTLAARGLSCADATVTVTTGGLRPGGAVTVSVSCRVPLADLVLLGVPGSRVVTSTATSPVDQWRGAALSLSTTSTRE
ncbi:TadE/TadG family type IV pilus assembly protein [Micromonospora aurantiaca (nom. illeg.)]|uniref:TadE/TadG family type IV pilus assembly protein n=1 Tax=Micromonospora aurantiaca (nom. illeg.) TaxID=47850 RepID=UPI0033FA1DF0